MSEKKIYVCLLGIDPATSKKCNPSECPTCGWEVEEAERRRTYTREHGLTLCEDGLYRLIIPKRNGGIEKMKCNVCDRCGCNLDFGETCDCERDTETTGTAVALENIIDFERQTEANNKAMQKVLEFIAPEEQNEREGKEQ